MINITIEARDEWHAQDILRAIATMHTAAPAPTVSPAPAAHEEQKPQPVAPSAPAAATSARKQRADKGKPRPEYKRPTQAEAMKHPAFVSTADATQPAAPAAPAPVAPEAQPTSPAAAVPITAGPRQPTQEEVMVSAQSLYDTKGLDVSITLLQRFGCKVLRDLKPEQFADYTAKVRDIIVGTYDPVAG